MKPCLHWAMARKFYGRHLVQPDKRNQRKQLIRKLVTIPDKKDNTSWNYYSYIRRVNLMLDRIDGSKMTDVEKGELAFRRLLFP